MTQKASPEQLDHLGTVAAGLIKSGQRVGLGSGRAALAFVRALGARVREEKLNIIGVPTSILTAQVAREGGIPLSNLFDTHALDITIDGADEVDPKLNLIKGGGGNLGREKVIASISHKFVIVVGQEKIVKKLGTSFPVFVEVMEFARPVVTRELEAMGAAVTQRRLENGAPFITDNGNPYLEAKFSPQVLSKNPGAIHRAMRALPGVVETGLFVGMASEVLVAQFNGSVKRLKR